jgi:hypothetical protein
MKEIQTQEGPAMVPDEIAAKIGALERDRKTRVEQAEVVEFDMENPRDEPKKKTPNRRARRRFNGAVKEMIKYRKRVYKLSPKLQKLPYSEFKIGDALFQAEAKRLQREGRIRIPPGGLNE